MKYNKTLLVLLGPTAVGKTDLSLQLAQHFSTIIVSSDSRQIYRELKIGTAMPDEKALAAVRHEMIAVRSVQENYTAGKYEVDALQIIEKQFTQTPYVWLVGGSGLYIDAVCKGIDEIPGTDEKVRNEVMRRFENGEIEGIKEDLLKLDPAIEQLIDMKNPQRVMRAYEACLMSGKPYSSLRKNFSKKRDFNIIKIGLQRDREELYQRINQRVDEMMTEGLEEEARSMYPYRTYNALKTVGYKELFDYFDGKQTKEEAIEFIKRNTRHYAKKQITWFARYPEIAWFHPNDFEGIVKHITTTQHPQ